jgi:hypothetical protein
MPTFTPPQMHVVRKEQKEARLKAFVGEQLAVAVEAGANGLELSILARSADSPVLKAVAAYSHAISRAGIKVRAVVVLTETGSEEVEALLSGATVKLGCDLRLLDAHEQLALGGNVAWLGDCMRREPSKRDAYEVYSAECPETAALAHRSFARVWAFANPGRADIGAGTPAQQPAQSVDLPFAALVEGESAPVISSRH